MLTMPEYVRRRRLSLFGKFGEGSSRMSGNLRNFLIKSGHTMTTTHVIEEMQRPMVKEWYLEIISAVKDNWWVARACLSSSLAISFSSFSLISGSSSPGKIENSIPED